MVTYVKYYEMSDGTWKTDEEGNITFEQAMKSKISSNDKDFFDKEKTIIVANG